MLLLSLLLACPLALYGLWILYLATENLARAKAGGTLHPIAAWFGRPLVGFTYVLDVLLNFSVASLILLDWPREMTVSDHLARLMDKGTAWQRLVAWWVCKVMLDCFDHTGDHCSGRKP